MPAPTQPEPAEGPSADDDAVNPANEGRSAETPAEGDDDAATRQPGSPQG